jgi:hypothetical protein
MRWTPEVRFLVGTGIFLFAATFRQALGPHPFSYSTGTGGSSLGRKAAALDDHSPPFSPEVKDAWSCSYISTSPYVFMARCIRSDLPLPYFIYDVS